MSGFPNRICKSYNYGVDWEVFVSDTLQYEILQMSFIDENIGYATHWEGSISSSTLKTINGGEITDVEKGIGNKTDIQVFPNPFDQEIQVNITSGYFIEEIFIVDSAGRIVINTKYNRIDTSQLASGIYFILVKTKQGFYSKKMIKK